MPITRKEDAKEGGWAQARTALVRFEGDVVSASFDQWGGKLMDDEGNPLPPREFLEVVCENNTILEATEELSMDISERFAFRTNTSDYTGSFWVDEFLEAADKLNVLIPDGLVGKRVTWEKAEKTYNIKGREIVVTSFVPVKVVTKGKTTTGVRPKVAQAAPPGEDPMEIALGLAIGKTEQQFRMAASLHPTFANSALLSLIKTGAVTQGLVNDGKLVVGEDGKYEAVD